MGTPTNPLGEIMKRSTTRRLVAACAAFVFVATACSGEATESEPTGGSTASTEPSEPTDPPDPDTSDPVTSDPEATTPPSEPSDSEPESGGGDAFDDPRGGIFAEFQQGFDRSHPFQSLDAFCLPHEEAANREATDPGITADAIEVHHVRQTLEDLAEIGFGVEVGDVQGMFTALIDDINNTCGGIRGRLLDPGVSEFSPIGDYAAESAASCLGATEDRNAVIAVNSSGIQGPAVLCITEEHETMFITTQGLSTDYVERSQGRLITMDAGLNEAPAAMATIAHEQGLLEGKTIGVVTSDGPGKPEAIELGLIATLEELGYEVTVSSVIGCAGQTACTEGVQESVTDMLSGGVDALFPALNILSLPGYVSEMVTQGYAPGDVQFFQSNFDSQAGDLVSSKVAAFGGEAAGALYNGAFIVDSAATGNYRKDGFVPAFNQMCLDTYVANGGPELDFFAPGENTIAGMLATLCSEVRLMARAIYDAGENPTRADIYAAMANLGPIDTNNMIPATLGPDKFTSVDAFQTMSWSYPCSVEGGAFDENNTCVVPNGDYVSIR
jgi:hypothetical protein